MSKKQQKALDHEVLIEAMKKRPDIGYRVTGEDADGRLTAETDDQAVDLELFHDTTGWGVTAEMGGEEVLTDKQARELARLFTGVLWKARKDALGKKGGDKCQK